MGEQVVTEQLASWIVADGFSPFGGRIVVGTHPRGCSSTGEVIVYVMLYFSSFRSRVGFGLLVVDGFEDGICSVVCKYNVCVHISGK